MRSWPHISRSKRETVGNRSGTNRLPILKPPTFLAQEKQAGSLAPSCTTATLLVTTQYSCLFLERCSLPIRCSEGFLIFVPSWYIHVIDNLIQRFNLYLELIRECGA